MLAAMFAFPIFSSLILLVFSSYAGLPYDFPEFGPAVFLILAALVVAFPIAALLVSLIIFGSIFLWSGAARAFLSDGWLGGFGPASFFLVAQCSAPLWYHVRDDWGYTFSFEESIPIAAITSPLFFIIGLYLGRIAFEQQDCQSTESSGANG
jgi:hypothetical protein